jgi:hypothetical protein
VYSLGTLPNPKNSEVIDRWHKAKNQSGPQTPETESVERTEGYVLFNTSKFSGMDSLMTVRFQVIDSSSSPAIVIDSAMHWTNIYGIDQNAKPVDRNRDINLYQSRVSTALLSGSKDYMFRVRYRDHNLKWSDWSALTPFNTVGINDIPGRQQGYDLEQNFPNPFRDQTTFTYSVPEKCGVVFRIYDKNQKLINEIDEGVKNRGTYCFDYDAEKLGSDVYFYEMNANSLSVSKKMIHIK